MRDPIEDLEILESIAGKPVQRAWHRSDPDADALTIDCVDGERLTLRLSAGGEWRITDRRPWPEVAARRVHSPYTTASVAAATPAAPDFVVDVLLALDVIKGHATRLRVHLTIAAILIAAVGALLLIASRPGG